jgi:hypothetical protein
MKLQACRLLRITISAIIMALILPLLLPNYFLSAQAANIDGTISREDGKSAFTLIGIKSVKIEYPPDSRIAELFNGKNQKYEIGPLTANNSADNNGFVSSDNSTSKVAQILNDTIASKSGGDVSLEKLSLKYTTTTRGEQTSVRFVYRIQLDITIKGAIVQDQHNSALLNDTTIVNLGWRGLKVDNPLFIQTKEYGELDVNHPMGFLQKAYPSVAEDLSSASEANRIFEGESILDFEDFASPMEEWSSEYKSNQTSSSNDQEPMLLYTIGEPNFEEVYKEDKTETVDANIEGYDIKITLETPLALGQIRIAGVPLDQLRIVPEFPSLLFTISVAASIVIILQLKQQYHSKNKII